MRLDHLLSREPILLGSNHGVRPVGGAWFVFLCSHVFTARQWVVGVGAFFGLGIKRFMRTSTLSGSRSTPCERPPVVVVARAACQRLLCCWCGCVWWVVCDLYSGCEHICSVLFFVFCLVLLGIRWMPWHQELMKDVAACDMPRGAGERALLSEGVRMGEPNLGCAGLPSSERV